MAPDIFRDGRGQCTPRTRSVPSELFCIKMFWHLYERLYLSFSVMYLYCSLLGLQRHFLSSSLLARQCADTGITLCPRSLSVPHYSQDLQPHPPNYQVATAISRVVRSASLPGSHSTKARDWEKGTSAHSQLPVSHKHPSCMHLHRFHGSVSLRFSWVGIGWPSSRGTHTGTAPGLLFYDRPGPRISEVSLQSVS